MQPTPRKVCQGKRIHSTERGRGKKGNSAVPSTQVSYIPPQVYLSHLASLTRPQCIRQRRALLCSAVYTLRKGMSAGTNHKRNAPPSHLARVRILRRYLHRPHHLAPAHRGLYRRGSFPKTRQHCHSSSHQRRHPSRHYLVSTARPPSAASSRSWPPAPAPAEQPPRD